MIAVSPLIADVDYTYLTGADAARLDAHVLAQYNERGPWGLATAIDLGGCDPRAIRDADCIKRFVIALCDLIEMKRFGEPTIVRFGAEPRVTGYSLVQLIETSLISGHFADESNAAYLDVFSCKPYMPHSAALFCREWFGAQTLRVTSTFRMADVAYRVPAE